MRALPLRLRQLLARRELSSLIWLVLEKLLQLAFSAISVGLIARTLGVHAFGEFQYALALLFLFSAISLMAGSETVAPQLAASNDPASRKRLLGSVFVLRLLVGLLASISMMVWTVAAEPHSRQPLLFILAASLLVAEPFNTLRLIREVSQNTRVITAVRLVISCLKLICIAALYFLDASVTWFILIYSAEYFAIAAWYVYAIRDDGPPWRWHACQEYMTWVLSRGFVVWVGVLALVLIQRLDRVVLETRLSAALYGQYTAAFGLIDSGWFFGPVAIAALAPSLVYRRESATHKASPLFIPALIMLGLILTAGVNLFAPLFIPLIYGPAFDPAIGIIRLGSLILIPGFAALSLDAILIRAGLHYAVTIKWLAGLATAASILLLDLPLSWKQGPLAIGAAYSISFVIGTLLLYYSRVTSQEAAAP